MGMIAGCCKLAFLLLSRSLALATDDTLGSSCKIEDLLERSERTDGGVGWKPFSRALCSYAAPSRPTVLRTLRQ